MPGDSLHALDLRRCNDYKYHALNKRVANTRRVRLNASYLNVLTLGVPGATPAGGSAQPPRHTVVPCSAGRQHCTGRTRRTQSEVAAL